MAEFNRRIRAEFPNNAQYNRLPSVPNRTAGRDAFLESMDHALDIWKRVNAFPASPTFTWSASDDPELASYQIRYVPGPEYNAEDETLLVTVPPEGPLTYQTTAGLTTPGTARSYKVYVRLTTGHEAGSDPQTVFGPA